MKLTNEQKSALNRVRRWIGGNQLEIAIGGLAGTGKTTVVGALLRQRWLHNWNITFLAPTGKAAQMLKSKGLDAKTIHSYMYKFVGWNFNDRKGVHDPSFKYRAPECESALLVVDEASMVSGKVADELRAQRKKILWVGDHGQLPPIGADPGIMRRPAIKLETIHRQLCDSPILKLAYYVRSGGDPAKFKHNSDNLEVVRASGIKASELVEAFVDEGYSQVIVGLHRTRVRINIAWRKHLGFESDLEEGDRLVCLKNNIEDGLMNGMTFTVKKIVSRKVGEPIVADLYCLDNRLNYPLIRMWRSSLGCLYPELRDLPDSINAFDYGYAITCHKAQGSEWPNVAVIEDFKRPSWNVQRWRYTACTRAKQRLCVVIAKVV